MGIPFPRAHKNLTVRRMRSVTKWEASFTELARVPPRASTARSPRESTTPVKSTWGMVQRSSQQPTPTAQYPSLNPQPLVFYLGGYCFLVRFSSPASSWVSLGLFCTVPLSLSWCWNCCLLRLKSISVGISEPCSSCS